MKVYDQYKRKGVIFLGLATSFNSSLEDSQDFVVQQGISWPNGFGADESIDAFKVHAFPTKFVIGRDGSIHWNSIRDGRRMSLEQAIEAALSVNQPNAPTHP